MSTFYEITQAIKNKLQEDLFVNTVTTGDIFKVDLNKLTIFPLSHIIVNSVAYAGAVLNYNISILCMDIVDESKSLTTDIFLGNDNEQIKALSKTFILRWPVNQPDNVYDKMTEQDKKTIENKFREAFDIIQTIK